MKLPDFSLFAELIDAKRKMGILPAVYGSLATVVTNRLSEDELNDLRSNRGIETSSEEIINLPDGTLGYKDRRVLVYIRDITVYGNSRDINPRFHVANCRTLVEMRRQSRFERYVVSQNTNGNFRVHVIDGSKVQEKDVRLSVCKNCLSALSFDGFKFSLNMQERNEKVANFTLDKFFQKYPRSLHPEKPRFTSRDAPLNVYPADWDQISQKAKKAAGWRCQGKSCGIGLSRLDRRKFLHVHHRDGQKNNNQADNLEVLCLGCHAEKFAHAHMKRTLEYQEYLRIRHETV